MDARKDQKEENNWLNTEQQIYTLLNIESIDKNTIDHILSCIANITVTEDIFDPFSVELLEKLRKHLHRIDQFLYSSSSCEKKGLQLFGNDPKVVKLRSIEEILKQTLTLLTKEEPADQLLLGYELLDDLPPRTHGNRRSCSIL